MLVHIHSIWSAYTFGMATSTVSGRFKILLCFGEGCQTSITASAMSLAKETSVALKLSGEYSNITSAPFRLANRSLINVAPRTATPMICFFDNPKTTRRGAGDVEL